MKAFIVRTYGTALDWIEKKDVQDIIGTKLVASSFSVEDVTDTDPVTKVVRGDTEHAADLETRGEKLARRFHELYEELAPQHGYKTRKESAVPWDDVPAQNKALMTHVAMRIIEEG